MNIRKKKKITSRAFFTNLKLYLYTFRQEFFYIIKEEKIESDKMTVSDMSNCPLFIVFSLV